MASTERASRSSGDTERRLRAVYVTDTMADVRMLEGLAGHMDLTFLAPAGLGDRMTNSWPPRPPARVDRVLLPGGRIPFVWRAAWWLVRNRRRFDVAIVLDELVAALAANLARRAGGPPVVLQLGRSTVEYVRCQRGVRGRLAYLVRLAFASLLVATNERLADGVGAISDHVAAPPRRRNDRVRIVRWYGVDTEVFAPHWSKEEAKRRLGFPLDRPVVMLRSRIAPEKDPETFLRAVALLREEGREFTAAYMGGEWEEFAQLADAHGVEVVARAPDGMEEIPVWYVAADVDVQTSHVEGLGVSPLEALACGTPIVVSDTGGLREVAAGGDCGELVPPRDAEAAARAIARILDDREMATSMARRGRAWVAERFAVTDAFRGWDDLAREVAGERPARRRVLFVDHEGRLSGGQRDLVDLVRALGPDDGELHAALPVDGELAAALRDEGVAVHVVEMPEALRRVSRWDLARRPHRALSQIGAAAGAAWRLVRLGRRLGPDVVHANSIKAHVLAVPAARLARARLVWHVRDILSGGLGRLWSVLAGVCADRVVSLSEAAAEPFRTGRSGPKVRVVHNGVRPRRPEGADVASWRAPLAPPDAPLVGIVGQLAHWKGQDVFVEAAARLAKDDPDIRFAIVGSCLFPENEAAYVAELHERVEALGLADRVAFCGQVDPVEPAMAAFDVLVHASRLPEPFGRVIVEGMALGVPVVASAIGAGPELVPPGAGRLVPPDDPEALAEAIRALVEDPPPHERLVEAASRFGIERTAAGVRAVYEGLDV